MNAIVPGVGTANTIQSTHSTATSRIGCNLNQILNIAQGDVDRESLQTEEQRELYDVMTPKYDLTKVRVTIEEMALYDNLRPHLVDATLLIPEPIPVISRYGSVIASEGNISAVVGAAKSKKTFLCTALVGSLLRRTDGDSFGISPKNMKVLWVDTEQSPSHVQRVVKRIHRLAGWDENIVSDNLRTLTLREIEPKERAQLMEDAIKLFKPKLVVIDGISDLMYNSNCIEESDAVVGRLMALSTEYDCHIMSVLHTNPNSDKARGHIGSTLQRKVETMLYVHKVGDCSIVEPQFCRNEEFAPFAFYITEEGLPEECAIPTTHTAQDKCVEIMANFFPNGIERAILVSKLVELYGISENNARVKVCRAIKQGLLEGRGTEVLLCNGMSPPCDVDAITEGRCSVV